ncbi:hypothetical protein BT93_E2531 [Corymbia citriodora subsp. variegata]|nr:hypothetical protein BT93_E2531 [Corymbia citriodora subsp. variegata]
MSLLSCLFSGCFAGGVRRVNCEGEDRMGFDSRASKDGIANEEKMKEIAKREPTTPPIIVAYFPSGSQLSTL